jgi:hypothetical protein
MDILMVDAYSGVELCTPIFLVRLAIFFCSRSFSIFFKTEVDTSFNKAQHNKSRHVDNI